MYHWWKSDSPFIETGNDAFSGGSGERKVEKARKQQTKAPPDKEYHGKQSLKKLTQQNIQLSNIEITDNNIKAFEKVAKNMVLISA